MNAGLLLSAAYVDLSASFTCAQAAEDSIEVCGLRFPEHSIFVRSTGSGLGALRSRRGVSIAATRLIASARLVALSLPK